MKPKSDPASTGRRQRKLFTDGPRLREFIDMRHELVRLADRMQWEIFEEHWRSRFSDAGGPMAHPGRRVAGLLMLQHMEKLSDERLVALWVTNPYYQYFCGEERFQHRPPINPTTLGKWRRRLGEEGVEWLLTTVIDSARRAGAIERNALAHLCVDSTVMEKNIAYPTDSRLLERLREKLVDFMRREGLGIRQSYSRQGPRLAQQIGRYAHARQFKRMRRALKRLGNWVGRLQRELQRQLDVLDETGREQARRLLTMAARVRAQARNPKQREKLYSLHEPAVDCISKGKARKRYEFGSKVGILCTQREGFVVGIRNYPGNPYDGDTLDDLLGQAETLTGVTAKTVVADLGYRSRHHQSAVKLIHRGKKLGRREKARLRRRSMLEAMIGHMKLDGLLGRCFLKGTDGDAVHALLCGVGHNLRLLRAFLRASLSYCLDLLLESLRIGPIRSSASSVAP